MVKTIHPEKRAASRFSRRAAEVWGSPPIEERENPYNFIVRASRKVRGNRSFIDPHFESSTTYETVQETVIDNAGKKTLVDKLIDRPVSYLALSVKLPAELTEDDVEIIKLFIEKNGANKLLQDSNIDDEDNTEVELDENAPVIEGVSTPYRDPTTEEWRIDTVLRTTVSRNKAMDRYQTFLAQGEYGRYMGKHYFDAAETITWFAKVEMTTLLENVLTLNGCHDWDLIPADLSEARKRVNPEESAERSLTGGTGYGMHALQMTRKR